MGSEAHVLVRAGDAAEDLAAWAQWRLADLERRWSRFRDDSEVSRMNAAGGRPVLVSAETFLLVSRGVEGWRRTAGRFDPTVLTAMVGNGYDRDLAVVRRRRVSASAALPAPIAAPGCDGIRLDPAVPAITLPAGVGFDPGGLGKGLAADLVTAELLGAGADGVVVNVGGDLRAGGSSGESEGWPITVEDPFDANAELLRFAIAEGGVATSSRLRRRWAMADGERHHLIDPATGRPTEGATVAATVVAPTAWLAEVLATALCVAPPQETMFLLSGESAVVVAEDGRRFGTPDLERLCA